MKNIYMLVLTLCLIVSKNVNAQVLEDEGFNFKPITEAELATNSYEKDTTANALILKEYGFSRIANVEGKVQLVKEYKVRIKIFNVKAYHLATVELPLIIGTDGSKEKLVDLKGSITNMNHQSSKIDIDNVISQNQNEFYNVAKFTFPNVQPGCVIEYHYKIYSPFFRNFNPWYFQSEIPKLISTYHTTIPANYKYNIQLVGNLNFFDRKSEIKKDLFYVQSLGTADCVDEIYEIRDIPAFKKEDFMTSEQNYSSAIKYELKSFESFKLGKEDYTKKWKDVDFTVKREEQIGLQARKENYFKKIIPYNVTTGKTRLDKAKNIYYFLQRKLTWNKSFRVFNDLDVKRTYNENTGSIGELNLVLLNFLKAENFDASLMLLSTRDRAYPTKIYPVLTDFNYVIVRLNISNKIYLLDITDKYNSFGRLPFRALNGYGRVFDFENASYWEDITTDNSSINGVTSLIELKENGDLINKIRLTYTGYLADQQRKYLASKSQDQVLEKFESDFSKVKTPLINDYTLQNKDDLEKPLIQSFTAHFTNLIPEKSNILYLNPFLKNAFPSNPFKLKERSYPVNFGYGFSYKYSTIIKTSPSQEIVDIPEDFGTKLPDGKGYVIFSTNKNPKSLIVDLKLILDRPVYLPEEYEGLKSIFADFIKAHNTAIVIKTKSSL
ncbi:hypothetical protein ACG2LH_08795 [Zhouia sp. PK063]|uniref:hypothetical protein n=1 Tax=Zhouia sp. PK063 TaxID=3373602 RepID=UPI0037AA20F7